jgi:hypothetical protein
MGNIIQVGTDDGGVILVETSDRRSDNSEGPVEAGALDWIKSKFKLNEVLNSTAPAYRAVRDTFEGLGDKKPTSAQAEFSLSFTADGNLYFVKASTEATIKIMVTWDLSK